MSRTAMRIVFNFAARCTLKCEWCYIDFGRRAPTLEESTAVIRRCREVGATWITIGGGDPAMMPFLPDLLRNAKAIGLLVHLDTNGIGLSKHISVAGVASTIDLLGLPLDGPAAAHDRVRADIGHFQIVMSALRLAKETGIPLKLNTMLCSVNAPYIEDIAALVREVEPLAWSIYRYWPMAAGAAVASRYDLDETTYRGVTASIANKVTIQTRVEVADAAERSGRTLLVTQ